MDKKELSERDICTKFITPALREAGWDELTQLREEVSFTAGRPARGWACRSSGPARSDAARRPRGEQPAAVGDCGTGLTVPAAMPAPERPRIYHIIHVDRLPSVIENGHLWCDAEMANRASAGTMIGMNDIKRRRLEELRLASHPDLMVGQCVPFYFCPRSVMLYLISQRNHVNLAYRGGEEPIVHLEADLRDVVAWADAACQRWAFTLSNAGAYYFEDRCSLDALDEINWEAVFASRWAGPGIPSLLKDGKQAEFLMERRFPWHLVERIGTRSAEVARQAIAALQGQAHRPRVEIRKDWYYGA